MKNSKLEIRSIDEDSIYCEVLIDGHVVHGVRSIRFEKKAQSILPRAYSLPSCVPHGINSILISKFLFSLSQKPQTFLYITIPHSINQSIQKRAFSSYLKGQVSFLWRFPSLNRFLF